jgi:diaminohydroxyphosphoribosylaminopyrimidine deaminase/5-amino-6-(5-phosphoribosylamino)uracil reductase
VVTDVLPLEGYRAHRGHILRVTQKRPAVTLKLAMTADGYAATAEREALPISSPLAMAHVHMMRAKADAIMIGSGTALNDDPMLNVRLPGMEHLSPVRVILDTHLLIPQESRLLASSHDIPTWIFYVSSLESDARGANLKSHFPMLDIIPMPADVYRITRGNPSKEDGGHIKLPLEMVLSTLAERGITRVFSEGGPRIAEALATRGLIDELITSRSEIALESTGYLALRPYVKTYIETALQMIKSEIIGRDTFTFYERTL